MWSEAGQKALRELPLDGWAACRREDLLGLLASLDKQIHKLDVAASRPAGTAPSRSRCTQADDKSFGRECDSACAPLRSDSHAPRNRFSKARCYQFN